ncbi:MAG: hypothetical protein KDK12_01095, partial [Rhodobacteraceae bacterium]|nr:hypothetical protein [Paracoccaceae bacterium]
TGQMLAALADLPQATTVAITGESSATDPGDDLRAIDAMFDRLSPRLLVLAGDSLPVPLIDRARARGVAMMLIEAANPSATGTWRLLPGAPRGLLMRFCQIHARDAAAAGALTRLVREAVPVAATGRLARHAPAPGCNMNELDAMRQTIGARPVWLAHNLPLSEADAVLKAHAHALRRAHRSLVILEPRDPAQGAEMMARAAEAGLVRARRAEDDEIVETTQVYVADAGDDPGLFLRLSPVAYLGGTLTRGAGNASPVVAAALGSALVFGPQASDETRPFLDRLRQVGGGRQIATPAELGPAVSALLAPEAGAEAALRAWTLATEGAEATLAVAGAIGDWLAVNGGIR